MRIRSLALSPFGAFRASQLDWSQDQGLFFVFGKNEAGKSTTLRAMRSALYGVAERTPDAHTFRGPELRIAFEVDDERGVRRKFVRRKGRGATLEDEAGQAVTDAELSPFLGGIDEETFELVFGLDHESLRRGGESLLGGKGELGRALFQAGTGLSHLHRLLTELREEAQEVFSPAAHKKSLNVAIKRLQDANKVLRAEPLTVEAYRAQVDAVTEQRARKDELAAARESLRQRIAHRERLERVRPLLGKYNRLAAEQAGFANVRRLRPEFERERQDAQAALQLGEGRRLQAEADLQRVHERLLELEGFPVPLPAESGIDALPGLLAMYQEDQKRLLQQNELLRVTRETLGDKRGILRTEIRALPGVVVGRLVHHADLLRSLFADAQRHRERAGDAAAAHRAQEQLTQAAVLEHTALGAAPDLLPLTAWLRRARELGAPALRVLAQARDNAQERQRLRALEVALGLAAQEVRIPSPDVERHYEETWAARASDAQVALLRLQTAQDGQKRVGERLGELQRQGEVPSLDELKAVRRERDQALRTFLDAPTHGAAGALAASVLRADDVADRLRLHAETVSARESAERELRAFVAEETEARGALSQAQQAEAALLAEWTQVWPVGFPVAPPKAMRGLAERHRDLARQFAELERSEREVSTIIDRSAQLASELTALAAPALVPADFADALAFAEQLLLQQTQLAQRIAQAEARRSDAEARYVLSSQQHQEAEARSAAANSALSTFAVDTVELPPGLDLGLVISSLALLANVEQLEGDLSRAEAAALDLANRAETFASSVRSWAQQMGLDASAAPGSLASVLVHRHAERQNAEAERTDLLKRREAARDMVARATQEIAQANAALLRLCAEVGTQDPLELPRLEDDSRRRVALELELSSLGEGIQEVSGGLSSAALQQELEQLPEAGPDDDQAQLRVLDDDLEQVQQRLGHLEGGLRALEHASGAEAAALEHEEALAEVRFEAERFAKLRLAQAMLGRHVDRYRAAVQGPVLARASVHLAALTMGSLTELRAGYTDDDAVVLLCARPDGRELTTQALSDGTRDALYLALRVATLEHMAESRPLVPFVLDDALVHLDDDRARAALSVLLDLSTKMQVIFFSHHARLLELAREVAGARLVVTELTPAASLATAAVPGP